MIIPWRVDVPEERWPITNWLIVTGIIGAFVLQTRSLKERSEMLDQKSIDYKNTSVEDVAKDLQTTDQELKETQQAVDKNFGKIENKLRDMGIPYDKDKIKDQAVIDVLKQSFVWRNVEPYVLKGANLTGLFGHMWLHGGLLHIIGNLLFLWIFGNAVCAKIGNIVYLPIYLVLGVISGISHMIFTGGSAIGASGAINGIVGMYLVFFPTNLITCYWSLNVIYWREFEISSYWMILWWLAWDIFGIVMGGGHVAYYAHLGGFAAGFVLGVILLKTKFITMTFYEKSLLDVFSEMFSKEKPLPQESYFYGGLQREIQTTERAVHQERFEERQPSQQTLSVEDFFRNNDAIKTEPISSNNGDGMIRFACKCGKRCKVSAEYGGKIGKCPKCKQPVKIPLQSIC